MWNTRFCRSAGLTALIVLAVGASAVGCGAEETAGGGGSTQNDDERQRDRTGNDINDDDDEDTGSSQDAGVIDETPDAAGLDTSGDIEAETDTSNPGEDAAEDIASGDDSPFTGPVGGVRGTVWAPNNSPDDVAAGQEIPIAGALVYLDHDRPPAIPNGAYCEACTEAPPRAVFSDHQGHFEILDYVPGTYWLVIQKGQFRRELEVAIDGDRIIDLPNSATTFPSTHDPEHGEWVPHIAMAVGDFDQLESILGKMGFGAVDEWGEYIPASSVGHIDIWDNGGIGFDDYSLGSLTDLVSDLDTMLQYHIIFIPCASSSNTAALSDDQVLRNIRDYVAAGGNLYVTDWSGEWSDNVFPEEVQLSGSYRDTPADAYDRDADSWNTAEFGDADGSFYDSPNGQAVDEHLHDWLDGQEGPTPLNPLSSTYNADEFEVVGNWNTIVALNTVELGVDEDGEPVIDQPRVWVVGGSEYDPLPKLPLTVTFEPTGCGRVLYSTYHTTDDTHPGLVPQERVLLHLIMEIGTCRDVKY